MKVSIVKFFCMVFAVCVQTGLAHAAANLPADVQIFGGLLGSDSVPAAPMPKITPRPGLKIAFQSTHAPGTVLVRTAARKLYYVLSPAEAIEYQVGVGREGFQWSGADTISQKTEWPDWRPPLEMIEREAANGRYIPDYVRGGPGNPLGARAIYIGDTQFRIHGTTEPDSVGRAVSSGCIRLRNEDVVDLYNRVDIGALVIVE